MSTRNNSKPQAAPSGTLTKVRLDRWLWAARFFKSRAMAKAAVEGGKVELNGGRGKPAKEIGIGAQLEVRRGDELFDIEVIALAEKRGNATFAATLFQETDESIDRRAADIARRKMERAGLRVPERKPEKRDRRALAKMKQHDEPE